MPTATKKIRRSEDQEVAPESGNTRSTGSVDGVVGVRVGTGKESVMSEVTFIGGPLDGEQAQMDDFVTEYSVPEVSFRWTKYSSGNETTVRKTEVRHVYRRSLDQPDVFLFEFVREVF